jgi:hypothetical protein
MKLPVVNNIKCFEAHSNHKVNCQKKSCRHYINDTDSFNCVVIASQNGPYTLQKIGKIYGLTRMRICQIEKTIIQKIKNSILI